MGQAPFIPVPAPISDTISSQLASLAARLTSQEQANASLQQMLSLSQRVTQLQNTTITSPTIASPTVSGTLNLTDASGSLTVAGDATIQKQLTVNATTATSTYSTGGLSVGINQFVVQQSSGNVGIGTTSPMAVLSVNSGQIVGAAGSAALPTFGFSVDADVGMFRAAADELGFATAGSERVRINSSGNVGIGTTSPWRTLSVAGTVGFNSSLGTGVGGNYVCIDTTTFEVLRGNGTACTASSQKFKDNIQNINYYGLAEILKLRPVSYTYKKDSNMGEGTKLGFIAEVMYTILPEVVSKDKEGNVFGLDYPVLTSVLTKAIQELDAKVSLLAGSSGAGTDALTVKKIASSLGKWSIDEEGTLTTVRIITEEMIAKSIKTEKLEVGSSHKPSMIVVHDKQGKEGCLIIENVDTNIMHLIAGSCDVEATPSPPVLPAASVETSPIPPSTAVETSPEATPTPVAEPILPAVSAVESSPPSVLENPPETMSPAAP